MLPDGQSLFCEEIVSRLFHAVSGPETCICTPQSLSIWERPLGISNSELYPLDSSSPWVFTKVMTEALEPLRLREISIVPCLDDLLLFRFQMSGPSEPSRDPCPPQGPGVTSISGEIQSDSGTGGTFSGVHYIDSVHQKKCIPRDDQEGPVYEKSNSDRPLGDSQGGHGGPRAAYRIHSSCSVG